MNRPKRSTYTKPEMTTTEQARFVLGLTILALIYSTALFTFIVSMPL